MSKSVYRYRASEGRRPGYTKAARSFQVAEDIVPIAELKVRLSEVIRSLDTRRPLVVTLNGKPAAVLMSPREYDRVTHRARVVESIQGGLDDIEAGRVISDEELGHHLERRYGSPKRLRRGK
jgi:prevent-host-death family protein